MAGSDIPDTAGRKTKRIRKKIRRTQAIAKPYAFHVNAIKFYSNVKTIFLMCQKL